MAGHQRQVSFQQHDNYGLQNDAEYNPYLHTVPNGPYYDQGAYTGYRDDTFVPPKAEPDNAEKTGFGSQSEVRHGKNALPRSLGGLRTWRHDEHGNVWTKGTRGRCFGRFFCCSLMTIILLLLSIVATLGLWIRPPNILFNGVVFSGTKVQLEDGGFKLNLNLNISVDNPNYFSATFQNISAVATYPIANTSSLGGGSLSNVKFPSHSNTQLLFPFVLDYKSSDDPSFAIAKDIASKCTSNSNIKVNYVLTLKIRILATISPTFSSSASFPCPQELEGLAGGLLGSG